MWMMKKINVVCVFLLGVLLLLIVSSCGLQPGKSVFVGNAVAGYSNSGCVKGLWYYQVNGKVVGRDTGCTTMNDQGVNGKEKPWCPIQMVNQNGKQVYVGQSGMMWQSCSMEKVGLSEEEMKKQGIGYGGSSCTDSDNGLNYLVKGVLTTPSGEDFEDFCSLGAGGSAGAGVKKPTSSYVYEYYCFDDKTKTGGTEIVKCENGCEDGKCLPCTPIVFADANLEWAVKQQMNVAQTEKVCAEKAKGVSNLELSSLGIENLGGLEYFTNLQSLNLGYNTITNVTPLKGLVNLKELSLEGNTVGDIKALGGLTNLHTLTLSYNMVNDVGPLKGLINLQDLFLGSNQIKDVSALSGLVKLKSLNLVLNKVSDISALSGMINLEELHLGSNQIVDVTGLKGLVSLHWLFLSNNMIKDISGLSGLVNLEAIFLENNQVADVGALKNDVKLEVLYLGVNMIADVTPLKNAVNMQILGLNNNNIQDISSLNGLVNLQQFTLGNNPLQYPLQVCSFMKGLKNKGTYIDGFDFSKC